MHFLFHPNNESSTGIRSRIKKFRPLLILVLVPITVFYCQEWFTHNPWTTMFPEVQLFDILFYEMVFFLLFLLTGRLRIALILGILFFALIGLVNYFVMQFRSTPIVPWDIFSLRTAVSVADNYEYTLSTAAIVVLLVFALLLILSLFCRYRLPKMGAKRGFAIAALILLLGGYTSLLHQDAFLDFMNLDNTLFTPHVMARKNGFCTTFLMDLKYMTIKQPSGYSADEAEALLEEYQENTETEKRPNILVIMNEAFSDPAVLGDFTTNEDYMPFLHSLEKGAENTITGTLHVSVKGGNTANTEWEFLTGNTMRFLPGGSVPYQQYIFGEKPSLVSWLEELGYATASIHPYNSTGWNRNKVYKYFGFDDILFSIDFSYPKRIRKYISDEACYDKIQELLDKKEEDKPLFVFAVTMQNHSSYSEEFDNFNPDIEVEGSESSLLSRYLSLMKISDQALESLLQDLSQSEEETLVVFFGDHQPNDWVIEPILNQNGTSSDSLTKEEAERRYQVPFLIWSNYDMESSSGEDISINYLASRMLQAAGLPLSSYDQALLEVKEDIPLITTQILTGKDGTTCEESDPSIRDALARYQKLQYYRMNDAEKD
ncbi:MAG: LTA synthase family protein [Clostridiales bacterium]|nr:LTA synthase family protein [Clostridiales bacterium]